MVDLEKIQNTKIYTKRLSLRKLSLNDADDMYEYTSQEKTCRFLKWGPHRDIVETLRFISEHLEKERVDDILFGIELKLEKKLIGVIRVYNITKNKGDISYILNSNYCKRGYMTEAVKAIEEFVFRKLQLETLYAYFDVNNVNSEKVLGRAGMKRDKDYYGEEVIKGKKVRLNRYCIKNEL